MSSNSPSGGMKEMDRSESNLPSRTHWWNWQSSSSTAPSSVFVLSLPERFRMSAQHGCGGKVRQAHARLGENELVVETELALGGSREVCAHEDLAVNVRTEDGA